MQHPSYIAISSIRYIQALGLTKGNIESGEYSVEFLRYYRARFTESKIQDLLHNDFLENCGTDEEPKYKRDGVNALIEDFFRASTKEKSRRIINGWLRPRIIKGKKQGTQKQMYDKGFLPWFKQEHKDLDAPKFNMFRNVWQHLTREDKGVLASGNANQFSGRGRPKGSKNKKNNK